MFSRGIFRHAMVLAAACRIVIFNRAAYRLSALSSSPATTQAEQRCMTPQQLAPISSMQTRGKDAIYG
jgi:hypothetical protein